MAFTATLISEQGPSPKGQYASELWLLTNTGGSTGGTVTSRFLNLVRGGIGAYTTGTPSGNTFVVTQVANSVTYLELFGDR